jgi:membrane protease subunit HflC
MRLWIVVVLFIAAGLVLLATSTYVVTEMDQVIITQFGRPVGEPLTDSGLHWKPPWQKVNRFDKRWLEWDGEPDEMPTREKTLIFVDTYARWRIADPLKYFRATKGVERVAQNRLDGIIDPETRNVVARHDLIEVVRSTDRTFEITEEAQQFETLVAKEEQPKIEAGRDVLCQMVLENAAVKASEQLGIELKDIQFQRVNYTSSVQKKVFDRMISERNRIAEGYRSQGEGKRAEILGKKELELKKIESEAYREVQDIKGKADAEATGIYAAAYNLEPDLFRLLKSLDSFKETIDEHSWVILSTDSDYFAPIVNMQPR